MFVSQMFIQQKIRQIKGGYSLHSSVSRLLLRTFSHWLTTYMSHYVNTMKTIGFIEIMFTELDQYNHKLFYVCLFWHIFLHLLCHSLIVTECEQVTPRLSIIVSPLAVVLLSPFGQLHTD